MPLPIKQRGAAAMAELEKLRSNFRAKMAERKEPRVTSSRVGVVLSGGGARGAYEAGALMAFQDAEVPTHIVTATSIGSINAASTPHTLKALWAKPICWCGHGWNSRRPRSALTGRGTFFFWRDW